MPIPNLTDETPVNQYTANSGETEFAFTFYIFALSDIKVYANDVLKTITTDYVVRKNDGTVIGDADLPMDGGKIIFNVGRTAGEKISLNRDIPVDRSTQFSTGGAFKADSLNSELTRILTIAQQLKRDIARSFRLAPSDAEGGSLQLPTNRANNILAFDANANLILTTLADIDKANVSPFIATLLDDVSASAARGTLDAQQLNANLTALAGLNGSANKIPYFNGAGSMTLQDRFATTTTQGIAYLSNPIKISNNTLDANNDIDFSAGNIQFSDGSGQATYAGGTGQLDVLFGTGNGMLAIGSKAINSTYHLYMATNLTTGVSKPLAILGVAGTAPDPTSVLPSGFTKFERRGSIMTDGSGNVRAFTQNEKLFSLSTPLISQNLTLSTNTRSAYAIDVPKGIKVLANIYGSVNKNSSGSSQTYISDLATTDIDPTALSGFYTMVCNISYNSNAEIFRTTDTSAQIGIRTNNSASSTNVIIMTLSWYDSLLKY